jgi:hypothetical protein
MQPLPESTENLQVSVKGAAFTRELDISFSARRKEIIQWINSSQGTKNAVTNKSGNTTSFKITPCNGGQFAEITVNWSSLKVTLHTYWS